MNLRAVLLDVDNTVVDTDVAMMRGALEGARAVWPQADPDWLQRAAQYFHDDPLGVFEQYTRGETDFDTMRERRFAAVGEALADGDGADRFWVFEPHYQETFDRELRLHTDVEPLLQRCEQQGLAVGAVTNSGEAITVRKLSVVGVLERFHVIVAADTLRIGKPDRRIFEHACGQLGIEPSATLMVGDEIGPDVVGALDAGLQAAWVRRPHVAHQELPAQVHGRCQQVDSMVDLRLE